jgi:hypothetical protein
VGSVCVTDDPVLRLNSRVMRSYRAQRRGWVMSLSKFRFPIRRLMSVVAIAALLCAALAHVITVLNPSPAVPDGQMAALYLHDAKLRLSAAQSVKDRANAQRLLMGAEFDLLLSEIHATRAELPQGVPRSSRSWRKR